MNGGQKRKEQEWKENNEKEQERINNVIQSRKSHYTTTGAQTSPLPPNQLINFEHEGHERSKQHNFLSFQPLHQGQIQKVALS